MSGNPAAGRIIRRQPPNRTNVRPHRGEHRDNINPDQPTRIPLQPVRPAEPAGPSEAQPARSFAGNPPTCSETLITKPPSKFPTHNPVPIAA